jgi:competence protein ComEC
MGIDLVTYLAGLIASAPGASLPVKAFAPWAILFLSLAVLSLVLWRTWAWRAFAVPLALIGLMGARNGAPFDLAVPATGESAALRLTSGQLAVLGQRPGAFAAEQWLRADGDARLSADATSGVACDASGCVAKTMNGRFVALIAERGAFLEDCARAAVVVTPLYAPAGCAAPIVIDRRRLGETGAVALRFKDDEVEWTSARAVDEDRPWSPAPRERRKPAFAVPLSEQERSEEDARAMEPLE